MEEYLYKTGWNIPEDELNELGKEGWELVTVVAHEGIQIFYFKKPMKI